jgi:hypothetical protein
MTPKDISRYLHQPRKRYSGARLQQGRLLLDSDFNESAQLAAEERREALLDFLGASASPDQGFSMGQPLGAPIPAQSSALSPGDALPVVSVALGEVTVSARNPSVRAGSLYLGGRRLALEAPEPLLFQRDFLQMKPGDAPPIPVPEDPEQPVVFRELYYLHAWEQGVTAVEDPEVLEPALGGADTSVRVRRMRRVEVLGNLEPRLSSCTAAWESALNLLTAGTATFDRDSGELRSLGRLQIVFRNQIDISDCRECNPDPGARFLGADNRALRIQLTSNGFAWAFDNAAPLYKARVRGLEQESPAEITVELLTPPADEQHWPLANRVIEIIPFGALLQGGEQPAADPDDPHFKKVAAEQGVFTRVVSPYDPDTRTFTIDPTVNLQALRELVYSWDPSHPGAASLSGSTADQRHFYLRMWHEAPTPGEVELPRNRAEDGPGLAGTAIVPVFHRDGRAGDYWVIALRPGLPEGVVPFDLTRDGGVPPHGPRHYYAPLALVEGQNDLVESSSDCRPRIRRLSDKGCTTFTVGDGVVSFGDFTSIQEAIDAAPDGGRVSVRAGVYRERIVIQGRHDLVLEGCGEATVLETPNDAVTPLPPLATLLDIDGSSGILVGGLTLRAIEEHAILIRNSSDNVQLGGINVAAGVRAFSRFSAETNGSPRPLILAQDASNLVLESLILEPVVRPALAVLDSDFVRVTKVTAVGVARTSFSPAPVMLELTGSNEVEVRDCILSAFGQVGVEINGGSEVRVHGVSVVAGRHVATRTNRPTQTQSGIGVSAGNRVVLAQNSVLMEATPSEHAAIVVQGHDLSVRDNRVEALAGCFDSPSPRAVRSPRSPDRRCVNPTALAWGGIHVRGASERVELRGNQVLGGVGHGVTLGSIRWQTRDNLVAQRVGAGRGQIQALPDGTRVVSGTIPASFVDDRRRYFFGVDEGAIRSLSVVGNRIEQMLTNGISVISVLGVPNSEFIDLERARIENNVVTGNLLRPSQTVAVRSDALPGDTVPNGTGTLIPVLPFGGIVLGTVTNGVEIRGNLVANNGRSNVLPTNGIFVLNGESITIADNRVINNGGRALPNVTLRPGVRSGIAVMLAGSGGVDSQADVNLLLGSPRSQVTLGALGFDAHGAALRVLNNTVVHPEGRALHVLATGPVSIDGNSFASRGNHGSNVTADQFGVGDIILVQNFGPPWEDEGPDFSNYRVPYSVDLVNRYFNNWPASPGAPRHLMIADGGGVLFNNNQVTFDWALQQLANPTLRAPVAFFPVALLSLDHLGVEGNQFAFRLRGLGPSSRFTSPVLGYSEPVMSHALMVGATLQVGGNRFAENLHSTILSMLAIAQFMNQCTFNQSTHQILVTTGLDLAGDEQQVASPGVDERSEGSPVDGELTLDRVGHQVMFASNNINAGIANLRAASRRFLDLLDDSR